MLWGTSTTTTETTLHIPSSLCFLNKKYSLRVDGVCCAGLEYRSYTSTKNSTCTCYETFMTLFVVVCGHSGSDDSGRQPLSSCFPLSTSQWLWSGPRCPPDGVGRKWGVVVVVGAERICAYHTSLSSYRQESACSSVGERTCIQTRGEGRSERNSGRMVRGGEGEKKLMPARRWKPREDLVAKPKKISLFQKNCVIALFCVFLYPCDICAACGEDRVDLSLSLGLCLRLNWMSSAADRLLTAEPI